LGLRDICTSGAPARRGRDASSPLTITCCLLSRLSPAWVQKRCCQDNPANRKVLALFDRAPGSGFVDVAALVERFGLGRLCDLAGEEDSGFSALVLVDMLGSFRRFAPGDFGLSADAYESLARSVQHWRHELTAGAPPVEPAAPEVEL
jgi:hypothetical protein